MDERTREFARRVLGDMPPRDVVYEGKIRYLNLIIEDLDTQILRTLSLLNIDESNLRFRAMRRNLEEIRDMAMAEKRVCEQSISNYNQRR